MGVLEGMIVKIHASLSLKCPHLTEKMGSKAGKWLVIIFRQPDGVNLSPVKCWLTQSCFRNTNRDGRHQERYWLEHRGSSSPQLL